MALETATVIGDLVATNPVGSTDKLSAVDDHIRLIKTTLAALARMVPYKVTTFTGTTATAVAGQISNCTNVAAVAVTLPASPTAGDIFPIHISNGLSTNTINPNGNKFGGTTGTVTIDYSTVGRLIFIMYLDSTSGYIRL